MEKWVGRKFSKLFFPSHQILGHFWRFFKVSYNHRCAPLWKIVKNDPKLKKKIPFSLLHNGTIPQPKNRIRLLPILYHFYFKILLHFFVQNNPLCTTRHCFSLMKIFIYFLLAKLLLLLMTLETTLSSTTQTKQQLVWPTYQCVVKICTRRSCFSWHDDVHCTSTGLEWQVILVSSTYLKKKSKHWTALLIFNFSDCM